MSEEPNEITERWREHRRERQAARAERRPSRQAEIENLKAEGYRVVRLTEYQFRVNGVLDLFPTNRRFHHIPSKSRGHYGSARRLCAGFFSAEKVK